MKQSKNEVLTEHFLQLDEEITAEAYEIDDGEKLKGYVNAQKGIKKGRRLKLIPGYIAAVLVLTVCIGTVGGALFRFMGKKSAGSTADSSGDPLTHQNPPFLPEYGSIVFDSLDKVNFYGGIKVLTSSDKPVSARSSNGSVLFATVKAPLKYTLRFLNDGVESELSPSEEEESDQAIKGMVGSFDLSSEKLRITTAVYFKLIVTENDTFLASKVGTGEVSVIITDLHIGINPCAMITFKNGERYYSCTSEMDDLKERENDFYTHLYIKGFAFYKDTTNGISRFRVVRDPQTNEVTDFSWIPYHRKPDEAQVYPIAVVPKSTYTSMETQEFYLHDLEEYYNGETENSPSQSEPEEQTVTVLTSDGSITPLTFELWREYYDYETGRWATAEESTDAYYHLKNDELKIPEIKMTQSEVRVVLEGDGTVWDVYDVKAYYRNGHGGYTLSSSFNGAMTNIDELLAPGEWYIIFGVEWRDRYNEQERLYERHFEECLFKLIIE